jgi:hypothetical protein
LLKTIKMKTRTATATKETKFMNEEKEKMK